MAFQRDSEYGVYGVYSICGVFIKKNLRCAAFHIPQSSCLTLLPTIAAVHSERMSEHIFRCLLHTTKKFLFLSESYSSLLSPLQCFLYCVQFYAHKTILSYAELLFEKFSIPRFRIKGSQRQTTLPVSLSSYSTSRLPKLNLLRALRQKHQKIDPKWLKTLCNKNPIFWVK